ncbi:BamA/TamA family outer membrane protein [uncultured Alistipes sp.]|jgi:surface antigen|uniref:translocation and assembly module lipoprotein TamL n=1 Tax=uncultured Alistipes sp. TaxID=538949 RepID=UPI0025CD00B5|nr:BamA/TamA family outer membrane protein [uncultured Alistipes sp.]
MNSNVRHILTALVLGLVLSGCSTTKRLGRDEVLYTGVKKIEVEPTTDEKVPGFVESAVKDPLSVKPNNPLYSPYIRTPLPIGLWVWNYFYTEKEKGFKHWIYSKLAKKPVLISDVKPELRTELVRDILDNRGYFGSTSSYELHPKKNPKKARLSYSVQVPRSWHYSSIEFPPVVCDVTGQIDELCKESLLQVGGRYDIDTLTDERVRITNAMRNRSYYYFRPEYLEYQADTTRERFKVDMRMRIAPGMPDAARKQYRFGNIEISLFNPTGGEMDSTTYRNINIHYQKPLKIRPKVLARALRITPGAPSRIDSINATLNNLTKLDIFRYVNLGVPPLDSLKGRDSIDLLISAAFDSPMQAELEVDFSSKSNSYIGPGLILGLKHKNIFHGGEVLGLHFNGAYEWQTGNKSQEQNAKRINSYELGFTASLAIPRLLAPRFIKKFEDRYTAHTNFQLGVNLLNRPKFFNMLSLNGSMGYDFRTSEQSTHNLTLVKVVYNHLLRTTDEFDKIMQENPIMALSFQNQLIPSTSYTYTFDRKYGMLKSNRIVWQSSITSAGNILYSLYEIFGSKGQKKIFGTPFSQFIKGTTELRHYIQIGQHNTLAYRVFAGAGYAYGNAEVLPYNEQFTIGGANSIRAFTIRSLGPGSYTYTRDDADRTYGYFDQTGDLKLEANVEFRFGIMGALKGAVFVDAGNIWLLKDDPDRPGGVITLKRFWDNIALGTGLGLRLDLNFLVVRADLGIGIHSPQRNLDPDTYRQGYYNMPKKFWKSTGFHLAIGYPF